MTTGNTSRSDPIKHLACGKAPALAPEPRYGLLLPAAATSNSRRGRQWSRGIVTRSPQFQCIRANFKYCSQS